MTTISDRKKGILLILLSAFSFSTMSALSTMVGDMTAMQKLFFRSAMAAAVTAVVMRLKGQPFAVRRDCLKEHLFRSLFGLLGVAGNYYAMTHMLLSDANMIMEMSPFFVILFSALFLREKTSIKQYAFVALALVGEVLVVKPSAGMFTDSATLIVLGASICAGLAYMNVRAMGVKGENSLVIVFFFAVFSTVVSFPFLFIHPIRISAGQTILLLLMGAFACVGQFTVTAAYRCAPGSEISIFDYSQVLFSALFGWILYKQLADGMSLIGYGAIITAAVLMFIYNRRIEREKETPHGYKPV